MARSDRLFRLLQAMRVMTPPITASRLAEETDVSVRSVYRDIDSLRAAGARIEGERGFGYRLIEDYALPPQTFDRTEIEAIVLGMAKVRHMGDPALEKAALSVLAKIAATLHDDREQQLLHAVSRVYRAGARYSQSPHIGVIREACWQEKAIRIGYTDINNRQTERIILPLAITYTDSSLTVLAWCCLREDFRMFRIDRISSVETTDTSFRPRRVALLRDYMRSLQEEHGSQPH